jgi:hypothetical protein
MACISVSGYAVRRCCKSAVLADGSSHTASFSLDRMTGIRSWTFATRPFGAVVELRSVEQIKLCVKRVP